MILGGARSGKSRFAEQQLEASSLDLVYLATATAGDAEMTDRIGRHKSRRGSRWRAIEEAVEIAPIIGTSTSGVGVLVDCLTLWLTNLMVHEKDIPFETTRLIEALQTSGATVVMVSNEVGLGIVPENAMARAFIDHAGILHQRLADIADDVVFMAAGLPMVLRGEVRR